MTTTERAQITITVNGERVTVPKGERYIDIVRNMQAQQDTPVLLVQETSPGYANRLRELHHVPVDGAEVTLLTIKDQAGYKAYVRGMTLLMHCAAARVIRSSSEWAQSRKGAAVLPEVRVHFVVSGGLYCTMTGCASVSEDFLKNVKDEMQRLVDAAIPFQKKSVPTEAAAARFGEESMPDKERLMHYRRASRTNIYNLEEYTDYYYGYMVYDTSYLRNFDLQKFEEGFVLRCGDGRNTEELPPFAPNRKLFAVQNASLHWGERMKIETVADLNDALVEGRASDLILVMEAFQEKQIAAIAEQIAADPAKKIVMIAGPSSSGKTTFSHRLSAQLAVYGMKPHPVPVDDYFRNREETPKNPDGSYNFECLEAIDIEQFNTDMCALLAGERVELPTFNFKTGLREYKGKTMQLGEGDILVIEGIHCLNDELSSRLPKESKFKIYISALTQLNLDEHNRIATTDGRLLRRIVRDARTRGTTAESTIKMWPSVRAGEENYIFPFQETADVMFNSALIYELSVLKIYAEPLLFGIPHDSPQYVEAKRLLKFLEYFVPMAPEQIPINSLVREFIGGGCFDV